MGAGDRFFGGTLRRGRVAFAEVGHAQGLQYHGDAALIAQLARDRQALLEVLARFAIAAHEEAKLPRVEQAAAAGEAAFLGAGAAEGLDGETIAEPQQAAVEPVRSQHVRELQSRLGAATRVLAPGVHRQEVLTLDIEVRQPLALPRAR